MTVNLVTNEQIIAELGWTKKAIKDITGLTPNTWRPPFGDVEYVVTPSRQCIHRITIFCTTSDRVRAIATAMGLTTIIWSSNNGVDFNTFVRRLPSHIYCPNIIV